MHSPTENKLSARLPEEILLVIGEFIQESRLYELCEVNTIFFDLALNARYRQVTLFKYTESVTRAKAYVHHLLEPHIVRRIRHVRISGSSFNELHHEAIRSKFKNAKYLIASKLPSRFGSLVDSKLRGKDIFELAHRLISASSNAISLDIEEGYLDTPVYWKFNRCIWTAMAPRLQSLSLTANEDELALLVENYFDAPYLQKLEWKLHGVRSSWRDSYFSSPNQVAKIVQKFLNGCAPNLRKLSLIDISISVTSQADHLLLFASLFKGDANLPPFSFTTNLGLYDPRTLAQILGRPRIHLITPGVQVHDQITLESSSTEMSDDTPPIFLNSTRDLTICWPHPPGNWPITHRRTMDILNTAEVYLDAMKVASSLSISEWPLDLPDLEPFILRISAKPSVHSLQSLTLWVYIIQPRLFIQLAAFLPSLRHLALERHLRYGTDQNTVAAYDPFGRVAFCEQINNEETLSWGLERLEIQAENPDMYRHRTVRRSISAAFEKFIPSLLLVTFPYSSQSVF